MKRKSIFALALASIGLLGGGSVCSRANAQVTRIGVQPTSGTSTAQTDYGVMTGAAQVQLSDGTLRRYLFSAGTLTNSTTDTVLHVERNTFNTGALTTPSDYTLQWPIGNQSDGLRKVKTMAVMPDFSQVMDSGLTRVFVAGRVPGTAGNWDLVLLALNEKLDIQWTQRIEAADNADQPVFLAVQGRLGAGQATVALGFTVQDSPPGGLHYKIYTLAPSDGTIIGQASYLSDGGVHDDILAGVCFSSAGLVATATGYAPGGTHPKIVVAAWDILTDPYNAYTHDIVMAGDTLNYCAVAIAQNGALQPAGQTTVSVTGWVEDTTGGDDPAPPHNYYTVAYDYFTPEPPNPPFIQQRWAAEYDGPSHGDDVPGDVKLSGDVTTDIGGFFHNYTWVTGSSAHALGQDPDALSILYDWTNEDPNSPPEGQLKIRWISRWDGGGDGAGLANFGLKLALDPAIISFTGPYIYVLAQAARPNGYQNYLYLSYDTVFHDPALDENKTTRWAPLHIQDPLYADCYYGVTNGDSFPMGFSVHGFTDDNSTHVTWYMMRTGQSWQGARTGYDMLTTMEVDGTP